MNKKGQAVLGLGTFMLVFIAVIVGVVLFQAVAQEAGKSINTHALVNESIGDVNNYTTYYIAYRAISDPVIVNGTLGRTVPAGNYTVVNNVVNPTTGELSVSITPVSTGGDYTNPQETWYISGTVQPQGYVAESSGRAIFSLIAIFFALAIAIIALEPTLRSGVLDMINR